jgi:hypothetical protein
MLRAAAARNTYLLTQGFSGPVYADRRIPRRSPILLGQVLETSLLNIDDAKSLTIFRLERLDQCDNTLTDFLFQLRARRLVRDYFFTPAFIRPLCGSAMTVVIYGGISQYTVKPGDSALFITKFASPLKSADKSGLQNILCNRP